jgi:predicted enzyme related to lactoylglutathione lyase
MTPPTPDTSTSEPPKHVPTRGLYGHITHTEFGSTDPAATHTWCANVLGWTFRPSFPMPAGEYHLFAYSEKGGGGVHVVAPGEAPGSVPFVHVADAHAAFEKAISEGAEQISPPQRVMEGVTLAIVRAPGGVTIGLSGP